jgi:hypothetical protein
MLRRIREAGVTRVVPAEDADPAYIDPRPGSGPGDNPHATMRTAPSGVDSISHANDIRVRRIGSDDVPAVAAILHHGFPDKSKDYFLAALHRLSVHEPPEGTPQYGFLLQAGTKVVGALLTIFSLADSGEDQSVKCNVACWYVFPEYRVYAPLLVLQVGRNPAVTYTNISPAVGTWKTIEAQGYRRFSTGAFAGIPALAPPCRHVKVSGIAVPAEGADRLAPHELRILRDHAQFGCISLVCLTAEGAYPFVFRRRRVSRFLLPCAQLIYCRDLKDLSQFAGPLGRFLALRGMAWMLVATPQPIGKMMGKYFQSKLPMYFKGPTRPATGDLAYTEAALFGF